MIEIFNTIIAIFIVMLICAPLVMLTILIIRTTKPKAPINGKKLEELEENDYTIVDDVNKGFFDVNTSLTNIKLSLDDFDKRLEDIETQLEKEANTIKGFVSRK
tara:strand:+ start:2395 stop:2706 length:312 start_codon:yes stop_codon:yes gene_type:complete